LNRTILPLCMAALLVGCLFSAPVQQHYFMIHYLPLVKPAKITYPYTVRVQDLKLDEAYKRPQLAYRFNPYEIKYYGYQLWGVRPDKSITDLLVNHLGQRSLFQEVLKEYADKRPDFEISGNLLSLEEFDNGQERYAHLALRFRLTRHQDRKVLLTHHFDGRQMVYQQETTFLVKTLSEMLEKQIDEFIIKIEEFLAREAGDAH